MVRRPSSARQQILGDADDWFREVSYGQVTLSGDVTNWLRIGPPVAACAFDDIADRAEQAASAEGFDFADYDRVVIYFPAQNCGGLVGQAIWSARWRCGRA